jgi:spore coat polysaccharide biosynthesis predicted glycosyltransferase SpsG
VLGGGVSLYEACALGVPAVAVPVVRSQEPTVAAFDRLGAALGITNVHAAPARVARRAARLLQDEVLRRRVANTARKTVDAGGAGRVARAIAAASRERRGASREASRGRKCAG